MRAFATPAIRATSLEAKGRKEELTACPTSSPS
jgi:hypothetical protein